MPRYTKVYAWMMGGKFYASLQPKDAGGPSNVYSSPTDLLQDASSRGLTVEWDNPAQVDAWRP